jgi:hypothetical protein
LNILYLTSGLTGIGRLIRGMAIGNAFNRKKIKVEYKILSCCRFGHLVRDFEHISYTAEDIEKYSSEQYQSSELYQILSGLEFDVLIMDLIWLALYHFLKGLKCKKVFISRQVNDAFFNLRTGEGIIPFNKNDYDLVVAIEPFKSAIQMKKVNPIIIKNRDEILTREQALKALNLDGSQKNCVYAFNGEPDEYEKYIKMYSYLEDVGYRMTCTTNYQHGLSGLFPLALYMNAFDLIICGGGYNAFWEAVYFQKEAVFIPQTRIFESQKWRIDNCQDYLFEENGADQLVEMIMTL